jgi:hypothetical protein
MSRRTGENSLGKAGTAEWVINRRPVGKKDAQRRESTKPWDSLSIRPKDAHYTFQVMPFGRTELPTSLGPDSPAESRRTYQNFPTFQVSH